MNFEKHPTVIFFHIPRTGGSTFWHSLVNSLQNKNVDILDTRAMSSTHYGSELHEQEFFDEFVSSLPLRPRLIHVHTSIDFSKLPENTLFVHGARSNWQWRKSWLVHSIKDMISKYANPFEEELKYESFPRKGKTSKVVPGLLSIDINYFYDNPTLKNDQLKKLVYKMNNESMLETLVQVHKHLQTDVEKISVERYTNHQVRKLDKHDTEGYLFNSLGMFLLFSTYPFYFVNRVLQKSLRRITGQASNFSKPHTTLRGQYQLATFQKKLNIKHGRGLVGQNVLINPNFENCSFEVLSINSDRTICANDWYLNRGGEIYFRQFSRSLGRSYPKELETFIEIENRDPQNSFLEILQELNLHNLAIDLAGEKCIFSFEQRLIGSRSKNAKAYAITYYTSDEAKDSRVVNTVHEIPNQEKSEELIWNKHFFLSRIPKDAEKIFIGILMLCPMGLDTGLTIQLKNMYLGLVCKTQIYCST